MIINFHAILSGSFRNVAVTILFNSTFDFEQILKFRKRIIPSKKKIMNQHILRLCASIHNTFFITTKFQEIMSLSPVFFNVIYLFPP